MAKSTAEKIIDVMQFLKDAFCIDGSCEMAPEISNLSCRSGGCFKLTDSKRGVFYVAIVPEEDMEEI